jgi:hypothetical protein
MLLIIWNVIDAGLKNLISTIILYTTKHNREYLILNDNGVFV